MDYKSGENGFAKMCRLTFLIPLLAFFGPPLTQPPPIPPILHYGEQVNGEITEDQRSLSWQFNGRANDIILVDMLAPPNSELDPVLQLVTPDGQLLAQDDDSGDNTNARIGPLRLAQNGAYQIVAGQYAGHGTFSLRLTSLENMIPLALNKPLEITLDSDHQLAYLRLDNSADQILRLSARSEEHTDVPIMTIYDTGGALVSGTAYTLAGMIEPFISRAQTTYIIALSLPYPIAGEIHAYHVELRPSEVELLEDGAVIEGQISLEASAVQYFEAQAGQQVVISIERLDAVISPSLYVRSLDGEYFLFSSTADSLANLTVTLEVPAAALYSIEITDGSYSGERGRYRLRFSLE